MASFVALYRGSTVADAELVAASSDPELVGEVAARLLEERRHHPADPVLAAKDEGRRRALRLVGAEARGELSDIGEPGDRADGR
jgi:hypothetical protein